VLFPSWYGGPEFRAVVSHTENDRPADGPSMGRRELRVVVILAIRDKIMEFWERAIPMPCFGRLDLGKSWSVIVDTSTPVLRLRLPGTK
jgi:hypothetical protein